MSLFAASGWRARMPVALFTLITFMALTALRGGASAQPPGSLSSVPQEPTQGQVMLGDDASPPPDADGRWRTVPLPNSQRALVAWYRIEFDHAQTAPAEPWMLYLPYWHGGGRVWLNGIAVASVPQNSATIGVRWERPHLLALPGNLLRQGRNVLHLRAAAGYLLSGSAGVPRPAVGPQLALQPQFDRRLFVVRTVPLVTVLAGGVVGLLVIGVWLQRRQEVLLGLFGVATLLWAARTSTFVFDSMPLVVWPWWRVLYHASNGGFIVAMACFALVLAGWKRPLLLRALAAYALLGPLLYAGLLLTGGPAEMAVGRWWSAGLIPVGALVAVAALWAAASQRSAGTVAIAAAVVLAFVAGVHDYLVAWTSPLIAALLPQWSSHRIFLLHHGANLLLLVMGVLMMLRFVQGLREVEQSNRLLEARVAEREREIAASYQQIATLQREQATTAERQRIMQDLHDGLGAHLISALMRAERGALDADAAADTLRQGIDEMRLAIEVQAGDDSDFRTAFGNFRFRWDARLRDAGLVPHWQVELPDAVPPIDAQQALHVLRVTQEALANVLKHAGASQVWVRLAVKAGRLELEVRDDGRGQVGASAGAGRGVANMRTRAERLGAQLQTAFGADGGRVGLSWPL